MNAREALAVLMKSLKDIKEEHEGKLEKALGGRPAVPTSARNPGKVKANVPPMANPAAGNKPKLSGKAGMKTAFASMDKKNDAEATPKVDTMQSIEKMKTKAAADNTNRRKDDPFHPGKSKEVTPKKVLAKEEDCGPTKSKTKLNKMMGYMKSQKGAC